MLEFATLRCRDGAARLIPEKPEPHAGLPLPFFRERRVRR